MEQTKSDYSTVSTNNKVAIIVEITVLNICVIRFRFHEGYSFKYIIYIGPI